MGRARKPLDAQKGHLTKNDIEQKEFAESLIENVSSDQLKEPPSWLIDKTAIDEWRRVEPLLTNINIIGDTDLNNLGIYCNAFSMYQKITRRLARVPLVKGRDSVNDSFERLSAQQRYYMEMIRKFAGTLGLTIDSRLKAAVTGAKKVDQNVTDEFGDI